MQVHLTAELECTLIREAGRDSVPGPREDGGQDEDPGHVAARAACGHGHGQEGGSSLGVGGCCSTGTDSSRARRFIPNEEIKGNLTDRGGERSGR